jgi:molybdate transport system regulatory protein
VLRGSTILLGPGKAALLDAIDRLGTIREAAADLEMSYMRAWNLVQAMNEDFREPLVIVHRGGPDRGGAELTATGRAVLALYRALESEALYRTKSTWGGEVRLAPTAFATPRRCSSRSLEVFNPNDIGVHDATRSTVSGLNWYFKQHDIKLQLDWMRSSVTGISKT